MKLARIVRYPHESAEELRTYLEKYELALLQLDYATRQAMIETSALDRLLDDLMFVHKQIYLDPSLKCIIQLPQTSLTKAMQEVAEFLCDHGSKEMQICGIRGTNLLPELREYLFQPQLTNPEQIVSAELELGAGPLATALLEDAQIVIVGSCDPAAPFLAAQTAWDAAERTNLTRRGQVAVGACLSGYMTEILPAGVSYRPTTSARAREKVLPPSCAARLGTEVLQLADYVVQLREATFVPTSQGEYYLEGAEVSSNGGEWRVRLLRNAGSRVDLLVRVADCELAVLEKTLSEMEASEVRCEVFQPVSSPVSLQSDPRFLVWVTSSSRQRKDCETFPERIAKQASSFGSFEVVTPEPAVRPALEWEYTYLSAEEFTLSVDTRPASEWQ